MDFLFKSVMADWLATACHSLFIFCQQLKVFRQNFSQTRNSLANYSQIRVFGEWRMLSASLGTSEYPMSVPDFQHWIFKCPIPYQCHTPHMCKVFSYLLIPNAKTNETWWFDHGRVLINMGSVITCSLPYHFINLHILKLFWGTQFST